MCHATHKPIYKMAKSELNKKKSHKKNLDLGSLQKLQFKAISEQ